MIKSHTIYRSPPDSGCLKLGRTLPSLLDEACEQIPNEQALNQWQNRRWQPLSNGTFRRASEEFALGLASLGLERGDRVAFVMHSDVSFCIADMGCLLAGLVDVPIDLTQTIENILYIMRHSAAKALVVSNLDLLYQIFPYLWEAPTLQSVIIADVGNDWLEVRETLLQRCGDTPQQGQNSSEKNLTREHPSEAYLHVPQLLYDGQADHHYPSGRTSQAFRIFSLVEVQEQGRQEWSDERVQQLRKTIAPDDLATILYIASETKRPKGVMLTHENISADILSAFSSYPNLETGPKEIALIFLPLTHIFARAFLYGHLAYGHSIYFSDPNHLVKHLRTVNPTILITIPRLLEKIYERIVEQGKRLGKSDRAVFQWALKLAQRYEVGYPLPKLFRLQLKLADRLVFARWRVAFGNNLKALICGGAALRKDLTNIFSAAGIPLLQGYGLTETSAVLCYNRGDHNRAGTVGLPIPGVEVAIAEDSEILIKGPFVMQGYYRDPEATHQVLDSDGWLHTGDLGEVDADGFLHITGIKKPLFKLSTGKYVSSVPLEDELNQSPLVNHAIAVGANHKFCGMLIFPQRDALQTEAQTMGIDTTQEDWLNHPCILALYQNLIDQANCHLPYWSTVRKFQLIDVDLTVENGLLLPDGTLNRVQVLSTYADTIAALYTGELEIPKPSDPEANSLSSIPPSCPIAPTNACPTYAKSLTHY